MGQGVGRMPPEWLCVAAGWIARKGVDLNRGNGIARPYHHAIERWDELAGSLIKDGTVAVSHERCKRCEVAGVLDASISLPKRWGLEASLAIRVEIL